MGNDADWDLLKLMQDDSRNVAAPFLASKNFWDNGQRNFRNWFLEQGIDKPEEKRYNEVFSARPPKHEFYRQRGKDYQDVCSKLVDCIKLNGGEWILDLSKPSNANICNVGEKDVSFDYLMSVYSATTMTNNVPSLCEGKRVVLDLGAGWGRIGHVLMQINPELSYCILDLPEVMFVARHRLRELFPERNLIDYPVVKLTKLTHEFLTEKPSLIFGCTQNLLNFEPGSIDLFVSINSIQEMDVGSRDLYLAMLKERAMNAYVIASEKAIHNRGIEKCENFAWPSTWRQAHYKAPRSLFWWPEYFETVFVSIKKT